jgi:hypothetical protein
MIWVWGGEFFLLFTLFLFIRFSGLPVLLNVKGPLKLQVSVIVIVGEFGNGIVVTTSHHTRRSSFRLD